MKYKISEIIGKVCLSREDGEKLYELIHPQVKTGEKVELDFSGVAIASSLFFNYAIGQLTLDLKQDEIDSRLLSMNLARAPGKIYKSVKEIASTFYQTDGEGEINQT